MFIVEAGRVRLLGARLIAGFGSLDLHKLAQDHHCFADFFALEELFAAADDELIPASANACSKLLIARLFGREWRCPRVPCRRLPMPLFARQFQHFALIICVGNKSDRWSRVPLRLQPHRTSGHPCPPSNLKTGTAYEAGGSTAAVSGCFQDSVGDGDYLRRGAVVAVELDASGTGVVFLEVYEVGRVCAREGINGLGDVADDADIVAAAQPLL